MIFPLPRPTLPRILVNIKVGIGEADRYGGLEEPLPVCCSDRWNEMKMVFCLPENGYTCFDDLDGEVTDGNVD